MPQPCSPLTPEPPACLVLDELAGWVTIQSVLDTLVALKIGLTIAPHSSAAAVETAMASIDAAIQELKGACRIASVPDLGASDATTHYFDVVKIRV